MALSHDLISQFAKVTNDNRKAEKQEKSLYGTVWVKEDGSYVQLDGAYTTDPNQEKQPLLFPLTNCTVSVRHNDRVVVSIKNHTATVIGNLTDPSTTVERVTEIQKSIVEKIEADYIEVTSKLTAAEADIEKLQAYDAVVKGTLEAQNVEIKGKLDAEVAEVTYAKISEVEANYGEFETLKADHAVLKDTTVKNLSADVVSVKNTLSAHKATIDDLVATDVEIDGTLKAQEAKINELEAFDVEIQNNLTAQNGRIDELESDNVAVKDTLTAQDARIKDLEAVDIEVQDTLTAHSAKIEELEAFDVEIQNKLTAQNAKIENLEATDVAITDTLDAQNAKIVTLEAELATVKDLDVDVAHIENLMFGSAGGESIQTSFANAVIAVLGDAQIKSAMIESVNADKITAGDIITNNVKVMSEDGKLLISDETIQISDDARVRVQIGKDANADYSINIWDEAGNLMFSKGGITDAAIKDAIIRNDMVSDDANISAQKLDINSLFTVINEDGSNTLKSSKIYVDANKQTLDVAFTNMTTKVDNIDAAANQNAEDLARIVTDFNSDITSLQAQIDGSIMTWFYEVIPTNENEPAKNWNTVDLKNNHLGDLYYNTITGYCYRWQVENNQYSWQRITDTDVTKALEEAAAARDVADQKRRVFYTQPQPPYDKGDLWVQGEGGDILRCQTLKASSQNFAAADWVPASKYTDNTVANEALSKANTNAGEISTVKTTVTSQGTKLSTVEGQISSKIWQSDITTAVDNIQVGGRNLIPNSETITIAPTGGTHNFVSLDHELVIGETYTLSVGSSECTAGSAVEYSVLQYNKDGGSTPSIGPFSIGSEKEAVTFTALKKFVIIYAGLAGSTTNIGLTLHNVKLEKGNKATDWTPAPEDVQGDITNLSSKYTSLNQTVDGISATVVGHTTEIAKKADSSTVTTVSNKLTALETNLDGFKSTVSNTYTTKTDFNNLSIGGRNLVINSDVTHAHSNRVETYNLSNYGQSMLKSGTVVTVSFDVKSDKEGAGFDSYIRSSTSEVACDPRPKFTNIPTEFTRYSYTTTVSSVITGDVIAAYIAFRSTSSGGNTVTDAVLSFKNVKVEIGNKATDWTPAPEDIDAKYSALVGDLNDLSDTVDTKAPITSVEQVSSSVSNLTQKVDSIETTVQGHTTTIAKKADSSTVTNLSSTVSTLRTDLDGFETSVANTYTTKTEFNNLSIGGRNLILDSERKTISSSSTSQYNYIRIYEGLVIGETYTFSVGSSEVTVGTATKYTVRQWDSTNGSASSVNFTIGSSKEVYTFEATRENLIVYAGPMGATAGIGLRLHNVKLEKGNKTTDWSPAPEDTVAEIEEVGSKVTSLTTQLGEISGIVSGHTTTLTTKADGSTVTAISNKVTEIEADLDGVSTTVSRHTDEVGALQGDSGELKGRMDAAESQVRQLADSISMLVTDKNGASLMTQTSTGWTFSTEAIESNINDTAEGLKNLTETVGGTNAAVEVLERGLADLGVLAEYVKIGTYEGEPCIELGEGDSDFKLRITNTKIMFMDGTDVPAHITNKALNITKANIQEELSQGSWVWKARPNGNLGLQWKGSD